MIKRFVSMLLSLAVVLSIAPPTTAAAADDGIMTAGATQLEISAADAFLWESATEHKTLAGINPEWYKTHVTDAGIQSISIKIPASTETIRKDFGGVYATHKGFSTDGKELEPAELACPQVLVDFSAATNLKTIGPQAFFDLSGLTGVIDLSNTQVEVIEGTAFKKTAITGVILPTTLKRVGNDNANSSGDASVFGQCKDLAYIRVAGGDPNAVLELPSSLQLIGYTGFLLDGTKIEQTMKTNPFVIKIPASVTEMQHTAIGFDDLGAVRKAQYLFEETTFTNTKFQNDCLFNSSYPNNWGVARFASKDAYDSFVAKYSGSSNFYGYPTYEFNLNFKDKETQAKLWGQSIQYEKNDATDYWTLNKNYALPGKPDSAAAPAAGQVGYWELNSDELKADSKLPATPAATELTAEWKTRTELVEPTVYCTLNGVVKDTLTSLTPPELAVPYVDGNPGKIGVYVDHPLLKANNGTDDNYVYFKYRWIDVQGLRLGARSTVANPETGSGIYNTNATADVNNPNEAYDEITIRDSGDDRVPTGGRDYTFYNCEIYGYYVHGGTEKLFYVSNGLGKYYLRVNGPAYTTDNMFVISAKFLDVWTITFDLNGGTAPDGVDYSPKQLPKNKNKVYPTPKGPLKPGYTCWGWKEKDGTKEYYLGMAIDKDQDVTLVAQYEPNNYTIKYDPNLADATGTVAHQSYAYDTADFKLSENTFTSTTKNLLGWSLTADAATAAYAPGAPIDDALKAAMVASADGTVTLYAVWADKESVTMTFQAGEGAFADNSQTKLESVRPGQRNPLPAAPTRAGYTFDGWTPDNDQYASLPKDATETPVAVEGVNVTYTAKWVQNTYTVTFQPGSNGSLTTADDPLATQMVQEASHVSGTPGITANSRYRFDGWQLNGTGTVYTDEQVKLLPVNGDMTFVASYTYRSGGGSSGSSSKPKDDPKEEPKPPEASQPEVADPEVTGVAGSLETVLHGSYLHGYETGDFGPNRNMTRAEAAQMFFALLKQKDVPITVEFTDVSTDAWYAQAVHTLASLGIVEGVGENRYDPTRPISRAEFAAIATRFAKANTEGIVSFEDVSNRDWFHNAVLTAANYGWISGYEDNTFKPHSSITRAEVTTIVNRMLARRADQAFVTQHIHAIKRFRDVDSTFWAYYDIMEATNGHDYDKLEHIEGWKSF